MRKAEPVNNSPQRAQAYGSAVYVYSSIILTYLQGQEVEKHVGLCLTLAVYDISFKCWTSASESEARQQNAIKTTAGAHHGLKRFQSVVLS